MKTHAMIGELADALSVVLVEATDEWERSRLKDAVVWIIGEAMGPRWASVLNTTATQRVADRVAASKRRVLVGNVVAGACDECGKMACADALYLVRRVDDGQERQFCAWCLGAESGSFAQTTGRNGDAAPIN